jgi:hypothetical protein
MGPESDKYSQKLTDGEILFAFEDVGYEAVF